MRIKIKMKISSANLNGFTLLETVVSIALFSAVVLIVLGSFSKIVQIQYEIYDMQTLQNSGQYLLEVLSKESRMAQIAADSSCGDVAEGQTFFSSTWDSGLSVFKFINYRGECIKYEFNPSDKKIYKSISGGPNISMASSDVEVDSAMFISSDDQSGGMQPKFAFRVSLKNPNYEVESKKLKFQTVISARIYP